MKYQLSYLFWLLVGILVVLHHTLAENLDVKNYNSPKKINPSSAVVSCLLNVMSSLFISLTIYFKCKSGNIVRKYS